MPEVIREIKFTRSYYSTIAEMAVINRWTILSVGEKKEKLKFSNTDAVTDSMRKVEMFLLL